MKRKIRNKFETSSYIIEIALELFLYFPRLIIRLCRWIID